MGYVAQSCRTVHTTASVPDGKIGTVPIRANQITKGMDMQSIQCAAILILLGFGPLIGFLTLVMVDYFFV